MKKLWNILAIVAITAILSACSAPTNTLYFQDITTNSSFTAPPAELIKLRPKDKVSILVNSRDKELAEIVNLRNVDTQSGAGQTRLGYTVDSKGYINFPVLGKILVKGMNREQLSELIQEKLRSEGIVNDAIVTVEYINLGVNVMGEVGSPGRVPIDRDHITIVEALSKAGDIMITGERDKVKVTRTDEDGKLHTYIVDLTNAQETFASPVYYLQQDDIVYVEPNAKKRRDTTVNGNTLRSYGFWMSLASFLMSVGVLIFK